MMREIFYFFLVTFIVLSIYQRPDIVNRSIDTVYYQIKIWQNNSLKQLGSQ